jgi:hypothetical protein
MRLRASRFWIPAELNFWSTLQRAHLFSLSYVPLTTLGKHFWTAIRSLLFELVNQTPTTIRRTRASALHHDEIGRSSIHQHYYTRPYDRPYPSKPSAIPTPPIYFKKIRAEERRRQYVDDRTFPFRNAKNQCFHGVSLDNKTTAESHTSVSTRIVEKEVVCIHQP